MSHNNNTAQNLYLFPASNTRAQEFETLHEKFAMVTGNIRRIAHTIESNAKYKQDDEKFVRNTEEFINRAFEADPDNAVRCILNVACKVADESPLQSLAIDTAIRFAKSLFSMDDTEPSYTYLASSKERAINTLCRIFPYIPILGDQKNDTINLLIRYAHETRDNDIFISSCAFYTALGYSYKDEQKESIANSLLENVEAVAPEKPDNCRRWAIAVIEQTDQTRETHAKAVSLWLKNIKHHALKRPNDAIKMLKEAYEDNKDTLFGDAAYECWLALDEMVYLKSESHLIPFN